jgi:hypothetical protein
MILDRDLHIQIPRRTTALAGLTLAGETDAVTVIHSGRHLDGQGLVFLHAAATVTGATGILDHLSGALALGTGLL